MSTPPTDLGSLRQRLYAVNTMQEAQRYLSDLEQLVQQGSLSSEDAADLRGDTYRVIEDLTNEDPDSAREIILNSLLPDCVMDDDEHAWRTSHYARERLAHWLNQYPDQERNILRDAVLDSLVAQFVPDRRAGICSTFASIGFRRADVVDLLKSLERTDAGEAGDLVLSALTSLGVSEEERADLVRRVHGRVMQRCTLSLISALRRLADPSSIEIINTYWVRNHESDLSSGESALAISTLTLIADAMENEFAGIERVWDIVTEQFRRDPTGSSTNLFLGSDVAPPCDSPNVIPFLLSVLGEQPADDDRAIHLRYLLCLRTKACLRPRQLTGLSSAQHGPHIERLVEDATVDSGMGQGRYPTARAYLKEAAWDLLLALEHTRVLDLCNEAMHREENPFQRAEILYRLACFRLDPLPETVLQLISEPYLMTQGDPGLQASTRLAAIDVARSSLSRSAFEPLLSTGFSLQGYAPRDAADALNELGAYWAKQGDQSIEQHLLEQLTSPVEPRYHLLAAGALRALAERDLLSTAAVQQIIPVISEDQRDAYERGQLVRAVALCHERQLIEELTTSFRQWAADRDDWLGWLALEALLLNDSLVNSPEILEKRLGLVHEQDNGWSFNPQAATVRFAGGLLGELYVRYPAVFAAAVADAVAEAGWELVMQLLDRLDSAYSAHTVDRLPAEINGAIVSRLRTQQQRVLSETYLFASAVTLAPDALAKQPWQDVWYTWRPEARASLADALGRAQYNVDGALEQALAMISLLTRDDSFMVRRSAYRAMYSLSPTHLHRLFALGERATSVDLRHLAAEAAAWLGSEKDDEERFQQLRDTLAADREPAVRQAFTRAVDERRKRLWASDYLARVMAVTGEDNRETFEAWRYGQALELLGDDDTIDRLEEHLATKPLPPHVRFWIRRIHKEITKNWKKVADTWPESLTRSDGLLLAGQGKLVISDVSALPVEYLLWVNPARDISDPPFIWEGTLQVVPFGIDQPVTLVLQDDKACTVIISSNTDGLAAVTGAGNFPG